MANTFSSEELLAALRQALEASAETEDEGIVTQELMAATGIPYARALRWMHELVRAGKLRPTAVWRTNIQNQRHRVGGYVPGPNWEETTDVR